MITTETVYRTSDGRQFPTAVEAEEYENLLKKEREAADFVMDLSKSDQIRKAMVKAIVAWEAR